MRSVSLGPVLLALGTSCGGSPKEAPETPQAPQAPQQPVASWEPGPEPDYVGRYWARLQLVQELDGEDTLVVATYPSGREEHSLCSGSQVVFGSNTSHSSSWLPVPHHRLTLAEYDAADAEHRRAIGAAIARDQCERAESYYDVARVDAPDRDRCFSYEARGLDRAELKSRGLDRSEAPATQVQIGLSFGPMPPGEYPDRGYPSGRSNHFEWIPRHEFVAPCPPPAEPAPER